MPRWGVLGSLGGGLDSILSVVEMSGSCFGAFGAVLEACLGALDVFGSVFGTFWALLGLGMSFQVTPPGASARAPSLSKLVQVSPPAGSARVPILDRRDRSAPSQFQGFLRREMGGVANRTPSRSGFRTR